MRFEDFNGQKKPDARIRPVPSPQTMRLYFAALGLMPVLRSGSGQSPAEGLADFKDASPVPDYGADAEFIEREILVPEDRGAI